MAFFEVKINFFLGCIFNLKVMEFIFYSIDILYVYLQSHYRSNVHYRRLRKKCEFFLELMMQSYVILSVYFLLINKTS